MRVKDAVGRFGEQVAADHLTAAGLRILERNWRCDEGELDLVAADGTTLVVVEVKTRSSAAYGSPAQAISRAKAARIRRLALRWLNEHRDTVWPVVRFDVVAVLRGAGELHVEHIEGAF